MSTILDICNRSLLQCGARIQISSVSPSDGSVESDACSTLFNPTFEHLGRAAQWSCLRNQVTLSLVSAAQGTPENPTGNAYPLPPNPWLYAYIYPSDCLRIWWIVPTFPATTGDTSPQTTFSNSSASWIPDQGQISYAIAYAPDANGSPTRVILTNQDLAQAVYAINQPNPQNWDSLFQQAIVASLAAFLAPALTLSEPLMQMNIKVAEMAITQARTADGNEGVTEMDHLPDWMWARAGGQGFGFNNYGGFCYENNMIWPGGY